jgi:Ca2+-binding EF-hand superfamily protein
LALARLAPNTISSITWLFRVLDVNNQGYLDYDAVLIFLKDCAFKAAMDGHENFQHSAQISRLAYSIFDMVNPKEPGKITLKDLQKSKQETPILQFLVIPKKFAEFSSQDEASADNFMGFEVQPESVEMKNEDTKDLMDWALLSYHVSYSHTKTLMDLGRYRAIAEKKKLTGAVEQDGSRRRRR